MSMTNLQAVLLGSSSFEPVELEGYGFVLRLRSLRGVLNPFSWFQPRATYLGRDGCIAQDRTIAFPHDDRVWPTVPISEVLDDPANYQFDSLLAAQQHLADRATRRAALRAAR